MTSDQSKDLWANLDRSKRSVQVLPDGRVAVIQGKGLSLVGAQVTADATDLPDADFERIQANIKDITATQKKDRIVLKAPGGKPITLKIEE